MKENMIVAEALESLTWAFELRARWVIEAVFEAEVGMDVSFHFSNAPLSENLLYCFVNNTNEEYLSQIGLGIAERDLAAFFPRHDDPGLRLDYFGELVNVLSGNLLGDEEFMEHFGHLKPSATFFSDGAFTDREIPSIQGTLLSGGRPFKFHLTVEGAKDGGRPHNYISEGSK